MLFEARAKLTESARLIVARGGEMSRIDRLILSFTEQDSEEQRVATIDALVMYDMEEQYAYHLRHNASDSGVKLVGQEVLGRLAGGNPAHHAALDALARRADGTGTACKG